MDIAFFGFCFGLSALLTFDALVLICRKIGVSTGAIEAGFAIGNLFSLLSRLCLLLVTLSTATLLHLGDDILLETGLSVWLGMSAIPLGVMLVALFSPIVDHVLRHLVLNVELSGSFSFLFQSVKNFRLGRVDSLVIDKSFFSSCYGAQMSVRYAVCLLPSYASWMFLLMAAVEPHYSVLPDVYLMVIPVGVNGLVSVALGVFVEPRMAMLAKQAEAFGNLVNSFIVVRVIMGCMCLVVPVLFLGD